MSKNYFKRAVVMFISFVMLITIFPDVSITVNAAYENTHINTGNQRADIVAIAQTQVGYHEGSLEGTTNGSDNYTKYNVDLYKIEGSYKYMWCQSFIAWCAKQADVSPTVIKRTAGTVDAMDFFKAQGVWQGRNYTPQSGDIIYFTSSSSNSGYHVGIVESVSGSTINTIEGNYSNKVARHSVTVGSSSIVGYGVPNYIVPDHKPPSWASVSIPKQHFKIGEEVQFTLTSDTGNSYTVGIDDENGNRVYTHNTDVNLNSTTQYYTHVFDKGGNYSCYITTYNDYGLADSGRIYFTVYENKPGYAKVSLDRVSYKVGEDVTFKLESDTGNSYTVGIDDANGNRLYTKGTDVNLDSTTQYYTHIFDTAGQYSCFITTYNDMGHIDSKRIYFSIYDTKPGWAKVDINSKEHGGNVYKVGQNINFNLSSDTGFSYTVGIDIENDYGTRKRIDTKEVSIHESPIYTRSFDTAGNYSCYITTYNDYGLADSERIFFTIYDHKPDWAKVDINSKEHGGNVYKVGQNINFNLSSDTGFSYTVGIDIENDDGTRKRIDTKQVSINESPIYTRSFDTAGNYSCYITTYNDYGLADSERIFFTVYDHKPDWAKVTINSDMKNGSVYDVGENIHFNLTSNTGFSYTVGIDSENGERKRIDTQQIGIDDIHSYTRSFSEPGKYSCYITTYNDYGLADSERVYFIIAPKGDCNADGEFNISDVVLLQKWLLTEEKSMPNWKSADLCEDDRLDVFDLCMMKRMLVENS